MSAEHLPRICTSAVRESLANVFGDKLEDFVAIFEKSFGSTLSTLRLIRDSTKKETDEVNLLSYQSHSSGGPSSITEDTERTSSKTLHVDKFEDKFEVFGDKFEDFVAIFEKSFGSTLSTLRLIRDSTKKETDEVNLLSYQSQSSGGPSSITEDTERTSSKTLHVDASTEASYEAINTVEVQVGDQSHTMGQELFVHRQIGKQLTSSSSDACNSFGDASDFTNVSVFNTWKKSVAEQTRDSQ